MIRCPDFPPVSLVDFFGDYARPQAPEEDPVLEARGLTKCYAAIPAVDSVSFTVRPGEILGYLGPNGSGKSTTVKMITGLLEPTRGQVRFRDADIQADLIGYKRLL